MVEVGDHAGRIAVLDIGKTNVKLSAVTRDGHVLETVSHPNTVLDGPPWRHHDLIGLGDWVLNALSDLCRRHPVEQVIASGHGSGGVLVGEDPDAGGDGAALPMIDYEQALPEGLDAAYAPLSGGFFDRGSAVMMAATHHGAADVLERIRPTRDGGGGAVVSGHPAILGLAAERGCGVARPRSWERSRICGTCARGTGRRSWRGRDGGG